MFFRLAPPQERRFAGGLTPLSVTPSQSLRTQLFPPLPLFSFSCPSQQRTTVMLSLVNSQTKSPLISSPLYLSPLIYLPISFRTSPNTFVFHAPPSDVVALKLLRLLSRPSSSLAIECRVCPRPSFSHDTFSMFPATFGVARPRTPVLADS